MSTTLSPLERAFKVDKIAHEMLERIVVGEGWKGLRAVMDTSKTLLSIMKKLASKEDESWRLLTNDSLLYLNHDKHGPVEEQAEKEEEPGREQAHEMEIDDIQEVDERTWLAIYRLQKCRQIVLSFARHELPATIARLWLEVAERAKITDCPIRVETAAIWTEFPNGLDIASDIVSRCRLKVLDVTIVGSPQRGRDWSTSVQELLRQVQQKGGALKTLSLRGFAGRSAFYNDDLRSCLAKLDELLEVSLDDELLVDTTLSTLGRCAPSLQRLGIFCGPRWRGYPDLFAITCAQGAFMHLKNIQIEGALGMTISVLEMCKGMDLKGIDINTTLTPEAVLMLSVLPTRIFQTQSSLEVLRIVVVPPRSTTAKIVNWEMWTDLAMCDQLHSLKLEVRGGSIEGLGDYSLSTLTMSMSLLEEFECLWDGNPWLSIDAIYNLLRYGRKLKHIKLGSMDLRETDTEPKDIRWPSENVRISIARAKRGSVTETASILALGPLERLEFVSVDKGLDEHLKASKLGGSATSRYWWLRCKEKVDSGGSEETDSVSADDETGSVSEDDGESTAH
ncbi:hypothetical protein CALCODRAFT_509465 [Calocera cornea HHB12733]|uniref:Uncharacterized protein n=1 Tax=Calocera cornea HHB12733 TaxID=1353952 RepID=A0A165F8K7_9BASI|nr:hypothetical protein CALCODRAFT_509465 [Calocera cornea HHB12733]